LPRDLHYCTIVTPVSAITSTTTAIATISSSTMVGGSVVQKVVVDIKTPKYDDASAIEQILIIEIRDSNGSIYNVSDLSVEDVLLSLSQQQRKAAYTMRSPWEIRCFLDEVVKRLDIASILRHANANATTDTTINNSQTFIAAAANTGGATNGSGSQLPTSSQTKKKMIKISLIPSPNKSQRRKSTLGEQDNAAIQIQGQARRAQASTRVKQIRRNQNKAQIVSSEAAVGIQSMYRGWCSRKEVYDQKVLPILRNDATTKIQAEWRKFQIQATFAVLQDGLEQEGTPRTEDEIWEMLMYQGCIRIQSLVRGVLARKRVKQIKHQQKQLKRITEEEEEEEEEEKGEEKVHM